MDKQGRGLSETVWTRLDRKAGAIVELTVRQLRHRLSTWVVMGVGVLMMALMLAFYIDSVRESFEPLDNDGDSVDEDGDGYPRGQEDKYGTSDDFWNGASEYPGSSVFIFEDDIDWNDDTRVAFGNKTWQGEAFFEASWIDSNYTGDWWDSHIDWRVDDAGAPQVTDCSDWDMDTIFSRIQWGDACDLGDDDGDGHNTYFAAGKWRAEGTASVPIEMYLQWGYWTEEFYVEPHPKEMYINEDGIDCFDSDGERVDCPAGDRLSGSHGYDDDGDCLSGEPGDLDGNSNGIPCDVVWRSTNGVVTSIRADENVDEDPDEQEYIGELGHRVFVIAIGKMAFVILLGLFIPLFLALGLVRDETENGTLHLLLSKPINRSEFIAYRLMGYLAVSGSYVMALSLLVGIVASVLGPGDGLFRFSDMPVWLGIGFATVLVLAAYGSLFNTMGLISPKYGVYICIFFGIWEFTMGSFSIVNPNWSVSSVSVSHWALQMIDSVVMIAWPDTIQWAAMDGEFGINSGLSFFWQPPVHTLGTQSAGISLLVSTVVLVMFTFACVFVGKSVFNRREIM